MAMRSPSLAMTPFGISLVRVTGPPCPQICGTRTLEERTASIVPVNRTSRLALWSSLATGGAARATGDEGREHDTEMHRARTSATLLIKVKPRRLDAETTEMVDKKSNRAPQVFSG